MLTQVVGIGLDAGGIWLNIVPVSRVVIDIDVSGYSDAPLFKIRYSDGAFEEFTLSPSPPPPDTGGN